MVATCFRRAVSETEAVFFISFGNSLRHPTAHAILQRSHVVEENFTGLGRHGEDHPCTAEGMHPYQC